MKKEDYLRKIYNNPEDIQLRMEFADYLIKEGNPVGNAIRLQCEADFTSSDEERFPLTRRAKEILREHCSSWFQPFTDLGVIDIGFWQGTHPFLRINAHNFAKNGDKIFALAPLIEKVEIFYPPGTSLRVPEIPDSRHVEEITFIYDYENDTVGGIRRRIGRPMITDTYIESMFAHDNFPNIKKFVCNHSLLSEKSLAVLATSKNTVHLESLSLFHNRFTPGGFAKLCPEGYQQKLRWLNLDHTSINDDDLLALTRSPHFGELETFTVNGNYLTDQSLIHLSAVPQPVKMTILNLSGHVPQDFPKANQRFGAAGLEVFAQSGIMQNLKTLYMCCCDIDTDGMLAFIRNVRESQLKELVIHTNLFDSSVMGELVTSPLVEHLENLEIHHIAYPWRREDLLAMISEESRIPRTCHFSAGDIGADDDIEELFTNYFGEDNFTIY